MEFEIHNLEQEAYGAVLRAFKAQSDALTWEKEGLITELRKELRVSDDEHRELLTKVNADDLIRSIREWRKAGGNQSTMLNMPQSSMLNMPQVTHDQLQSPTVSASRKKQKTSQSVSLPFVTPSQPLHHQPITPTSRPTSSAWGSTPGTGGRRPNPGQPRFSSARPTRYQLNNHGSSGGLSVDESAERIRDPLIGRKVMTRWPEDNNFYEAVIADYNHVEGLHALVYDSNTPNETWEWVDLKEIPPHDIRWVGNDPGISRVSRSGGEQGHAIHIPSSGVVRGSENQALPSQNGVTENVPDEIEILHTGTLLQKVEKVFDASNPDLQEIEKAKKILKEHELALLDVISKLTESMDGGSNNANSGQGTIQYAANRQDNDVAAQGRISSYETAGGQVASDHQQDVIVV